MIIGKLVATSIFQGGPGFPVLLPSAYHYISSGECKVDEMDVPDPVIRNLLQTVSGYQPAIYCEMFMS